VDLAPTIAPSSNFAFMVLSLPRVAELAVFLAAEVLLNVLIVALIDLQVSSTSINQLPSFSDLGPFPFPRLRH
jgi:hypothetical protein